MKAARAREKDDASGSEPESEVSAELRRSDRLVTEHSIASLQEDPSNADLRISLKSPTKKRGNKKHGSKSPGTKSGGKPPKSGRKKQKK